MKLIKRRIKLFESFIKEIDSSKREMDPALTDDETETQENKEKSKEKPKEANNNEQEKDIIDELNEYFKNKKFNYGNTLLGKR